MTTNTHTQKNSTVFALEDRILELDVSRDGKVTRRPITKLRRGAGRLENTLLSALYPSIQVAIVHIPKQMETHEDVRVHERMVDFSYRGVRYTLAGGSGSAKDARFYFVDQKHALLIAKRYHNWPEAALSYFGTLVSSCEKMIRKPDVKLLFVPDWALGTNDCRGWVVDDIAEEMGLAKGHLYQFRLAFDAGQAKGCLKRMDREVADALGADIILPESSIKPSLKMEADDSQFLKRLKTIVPSALSIFTPWVKSGRAHRDTLRNAMAESFSIFGPDRRVRGDVVLGVREISKEREQKSSYQLTQFVPDELLEPEILPESLAAIDRLTNAIQEGRYEDLMEMLGGGPETSLPAGLEQEADDDREFDIVRALLAADGSGNGTMIRYPYIRKRLNEVLASWGFKVTTGGGYRLPAYMLADDGYLTLLNGTVYCGSDWIPQEGAILTGDSERALVVRYPVRMFEDLLPVRRLSATELQRLLRERFGKQGCQVSDQVLEDIIERQLALQGTITLHSKTASEFGGDFDGDWCGLIRQDRFPRLVASRFDLAQPFKQTKTKREKKKSNPINAEAVAIAAVGNQIGPITVLISRCLAAGRPDLSYELVEQLQNALDSLKWQIKPDLDLVREIRNQVRDYAPWLAYRNVRRISDLPEYLEVPETDRVGRLYNLVRPHIGEFFQGESKIKDFKGLVLHSSPTREMLAECKSVNGAYAAVLGRIRTRMEPIVAQLEKAKGELEAAEKTVKDDPTPENKDLVRRKRHAKSCAEEDLAIHQERRKEEMGAIIDWVQLWAEGKTTHREAWCQALHRIVCQGEGNGSILVFAFPQELVNKTAERLKGKALALRLAKVCDGFQYIDDDGRTFLVELVKNGENHGWKLTYLFTFKNGKYSDEEIPERDLTTGEAAHLQSARTPEPSPDAEQTANPNQGSTSADDVSFDTDELSKDEVFPPASWNAQDAGTEEEQLRQQQYANAAPEQE